MVDVEERDVKFGGDSDKRSFRQIILKHVDKIVEISCKEFTSNITREVIHQNFTEKVRNEDNRECYIQAVESLAYLLMPYFDLKMQKKFTELTEIHDMMTFEFTEKHKKEIEVVKDKSNVSKTHLIKDRWSLRDSKKLFQELMLLLKREDFLKADDLGSEE